MKAEGAVTSLSMDELNNEGLVGTTTGTIYYVNISEKVIIKLVSKASCMQDEVSLVRFNQANPALFLTSSGANSNVVKLWATSSVD